MSDSRVCPDCGAQIPADAPEGLCRKCLLKLGLQQPKCVHIRCPHCHNPVELLDESPLIGIECPSCGSNFNFLTAETASQATGETQRIGQFELLEQVGMGHFGSVWKARDTELDRTVAVKIPRKGQLNAAEIEHFLREARAAAQIRHPNIVSVHEVGRAEDSVYIVSDFVDGASLSDWITGRRLTPSEAAQLCMKTADALQEAHESGVIHRDLKPANIILDMSGTPHITDFGLAKRESGEITVTVDGRILGTPAYMSPEQARGEGHTADCRSDVYSMGVILFQLLTGELPFKGELRILTVQILKDEPPRPRRLNRRIPRDLETICLKCLEKEPNRRYPTARDLADDLRRYLRSETIRARPVGRIRRTWRWCKRNPAVASLTAVTVALLAVVAVVTLIRPDDSTLMEVELARAFELQGQSLHETRQYDSAEDAYQKAIEIWEQLHKEYPEYGPQFIAPVRRQLSNVYFDRGDNYRAQGEHEKAAADYTKAQELTRAEPFALSFDGTNDYVLTPIRYDGSHPITVEAIVTPVSQNPSNQAGISHWLDSGGGTIVADGEQGALALVNSAAGFLLRVRGEDGYVDTVCWRSHFAQSQVHLAAVFDNRRVRLFLDGKLSAESALTGRFVPSPRPFMIGANPEVRRQASSRVFKGIIDEVRISKSARYVQDFEPATHFETDLETLALYHFDEGGGDVAHDNSGNGHHGQLQGAQWVEADFLPPSLPPRSAKPLWNPWKGQAPPREPVNLLTLVDLDRDATPGSSGLDGKAIVLRSSEGRLRIPYVPPDEYDLVITAKRVVGSAPLRVGLALGGTRCLLTIDSPSDDGYLSGISDLSGELSDLRDSSYSGQLLPYEMPVTILCEARRLGHEHTLRMVCDGREICRWQGDPKSLSMQDSSELQDDNVPFLTLGPASQIGLTTCNINSMQLIPISGQGKAVFAGEQATPDQRAAELVLWKGGSVNVSVDGQARVRLGRVFDLPASFQLDGIDLGGTKHFTHDDFRCLAGVRRLRTLTLSDPAWLLDADQTMVDSLKGLEELTLAGRFTGENDLGRLADLPRLKRLVLHSLDISGEALAPLRDCQQLRSLDFSGTPLTDESLPLLARLGQLEELEVGQSPITDDGLAHLAGCQSLRRLVLSGTQVTDQGLEHLAKMSKLETVDLSGTRISDEGLRVVARFPAVRDLTLDHTSVTDAGMANLGNLSNLKQLSLVDTNVSDDTLAMLRNLRDLNNLVLIGTKVSPTGVSQLTEALPQCHVERESGNSVDLLKLISGERDAVAGSWATYEHALYRYGRVGSARLQIPFSPPEEYMLEIIAERRSGNGCLFAGLVAEGRQFTVVLDRPQEDGFINGLELIDGSELGENGTACQGLVFPSNQLVKVRIFVRKSGISVRTPNRLLVNWNGSTARFSLQERWTVPKRDTLLIGSESSRFWFRKLRCTAISGRGNLREPAWPSANPLADAPPQVPPGVELESKKGIDLLAHIEPARDRLKGAWVYERGVLSGSAVGGDYGTLRVPCIPPEQYDLVVTVERLWGKSVLYFGLVVGGHRCSVFSGNSRTGIQVKNEPYPYIREGLYKGNVLPIGQPRTIVFQVRKAARQHAVRMFCEGREITQWKGDVNDLVEVDAVHGPEMAPLDTPLSLGVHSGFRFYRMKLLPVSEDQPRFLFQRETAPKDRVAAERVLWKGGVVTVAEQSTPALLVDRISKLPPASTVTGVNLRRNKAFFATDFACLRGLEGLREIDLSNSAVTDADLEHLSQLGSLENLDLAFTDVSDAGISHLEHSNSLHRLVLGRTRVTDTALKHLAMLTQLEELNLDATQVTDVGLGHLTPLTSLKQLVLDDTQITDAGTEHLVRFSGLRVLSLLGTRISDAGLANLAALPSLEKLCVVNTAVTDAGMTKLAKVLPECRVEATLGEAVDLLAQIEPGRDGVEGTWSFAGHMLVSPNATDARLAIPVRPPDEYVVELAGRRRSGSLGLFVGLVGAGRQFTVKLDGRRMPYEGCARIAGLEQLDGKPAPPNETVCKTQGFSMGEPFSIRVTVRKSRIRVASHNRLLFDWTGDFERLSLDDRWAVPDSDVLFLGSHQSSFEISKLELTPISTGRQPVSADKPTTPE